MSLKRKVTVPDGGVSAATGCPSGRQSSIRLIRRKHRIERVAAGLRQWMIATVSPLVNRQCTGQQRLRLRVAPLFAIHVGEAAEGLRDVGMIESERPERLLPNR